MKSFEKICRDIKEVRIQGAESIAIAGVKALSMRGASAKKLLSLRPTEPFLKNSLNAAKKLGNKYVLDFIEDSRKRYAEFGSRVVRKIVFTHCHSSSVMRALKRAKQKGKKFEVIFTETRPLYQGRITARNLSKMGIKSTMIPDSAGGDSLEKGGSIKKADVMMIGSDAILKNGDVINKVGSGMFAEIAYRNKIPVYVITNSWSFSNEDVKIEMRNFWEIWDKAPSHIKIKNPAFEKIDKKHITGIISELGILKPKAFVKAVKKRYPFLKAR